MIKAIDARNVFKSGVDNQGFTNQIQLTIAGHPVEIRVHIVDGKAINFDAFIGHGPRNLGNLIKIMEHIV